MQLDDETLIAFADGELDAPRRRAVEAALAADPLLREQLERQQRLRARIAAHYAPVADEPVPERLSALLSGGAEENNVVSLADARAKRARPMWQTLTALAATLVLGLFAGSLVPRGSGPVAVENGAMVARGNLAEALETQLASTQAGAGTRIGVSFAAADGRFCRTFEAPALAGLACRGEDGWQLVTTAAPAGGAAEGGYRQASSGSRLVLEAAQEMMAGDPLDAEAERRASEAGWTIRTPAR